MTGVRKTDGTMRLAGTGLSGMKEYHGQSFKAEFDGKFAGERYTGKGKLGTRECGLTLVRAGQTQSAAAPSAKQAASPKSYEGQWTGTFACSGGKDPDRTFPALVSYSAKGFDVQANKPGDPGYRQLTGLPQPDGSMRLTGNALSGAKSPYLASVEGKFSGDRYEGKGKFLDRNCILTFARP
jgi:hypothetical protein